MNNKNDLSIPIEHFSNKLLAVLAGLSLLLMEYNITGTHINLSFLLLLLGFLLTINSPARRSGIDHYFLFLGGVFIFLNIISFFMNGSKSWYSSSTWNNIIFLIPITFLTLYWYPNRISINVFIKVVSFIAIIASVIVIYQRLSFVLLGSYYNNFVINFIPGIEFYRDDYYEIHWRAAAFFSEPSHYALYSLPVFVYYMLKRNLLISIILVFGIISSGSTNGLICMAIVSLYIVLTDWSKIKGNMKNYFYSILFILLFVVLYHYMNMYFPDIMLSNMGKLENTDAINYSRLLGPLPILQNFNDSNWLFGIGIGNKNSYISFLKINVAGGTGDTYANTFFSLIIYFGIIGIIVYSVMVLKLYRKCCKNYSKSFLITMLILFFSTNFVFDNITYYCFFIINTRFLVNDNIAKNKMKYNVQGLLSGMY
jgi:hypothetical protein